MTLRGGLDSEPMPQALAILQIVPRLDTGGAEMATIEISAALASVGALPLVASEGGRLEPELAVAGGRLVRFPASTKNPFTMGMNIERLTRLCRREDVKLIHARSRAPAWTALATARRLNLPFVTTYHGAYGGNNALKTLYNGVMARGDRVIANSQYTARLIAERHGTGPDRLRVIYRGVDLEVFDPTGLSPYRVERLRTEWGVPPDRRIILHPARLTGWKGQRVVIEAAARLKSGNALGNAVVVLAGDAQGRETYKGELEALIRNAGLEQDVVIAGHCDDMPAAYFTSHVTVVASTEPEAFGRASAESQAIGCPVIVTNLGGVPETIVPPSGRGNFTGWLVPPFDAQALADVLQRALAMTPEVRAHVGRLARAHIAKRFSLDAMKKGTLAVYYELLTAPKTVAAETETPQEPELTEPGGADLSAR